MANDPDNRDAQRMGWLYATAINFAASVAIFTVGGYLLDRWLRTAPWLLMVGLVLGLVGGTIKFVRDGMRMNNEVADDSRRRGRGRGWQKVEDEAGPSGE